ncbi:MAG: fused uroporphyrinogen-III synthase HemD/membrane protein HemX, partial [Polynucleobacter sp.]
MPAIILTRPIGQSHRLSELLSERAPQLLQVQLPLLSIVPSEDPQELARVKNLIQEVDLVVFVSLNAIECVLRAWGAQWRTRLPVAVVGGGSLDTL